MPQVRREDLEDTRMRGRVGKPLHLISNVTDEAERPKRENFLKREGEKRNCYKKVPSSTNLRQAQISL